MLWVTIDHFPALNHICFEIWILHHSALSILWNHFFWTELTSVIFSSSFSELFCYVKDVLLCFAQLVQTLCHLTNIFPGGFQVPCQIWREWVSFKPLFDLTLLLLMLCAVYGDWLRQWQWTAPPPSSSEVVLPGRVVFVKSAPVVLFLLSYLDWNKEIPDIVISSIVIQLVWLELVMRKSMPLPVLVSWECCRMVSDLSDPSFLCN